MEDKLTPAEAKKGLGIDALTAVSTVGSVATPVAIALTGMLYVCGWSYRRMYLQQFGLDSKISDLSLQETLATGFLPLVFGSIVTGLILGLAWITRRESGRQKRSRWLRWAQTLNRWFRVSQAVIFVLTYSSVTGTIFGLVDASREKRLLRDGCPNFCFIYRVKNRDVVGSLIFQDKDRTAIYLNGGVLIFRTDELHSVRPYTPVAATSSDKAPNPAAAAAPPAPPPSPGTPG